MFKRLNNIGIVCLLVICGSISSVFAIDFSQAFSQAESKVLNVQKLFQGKASVNNLYSKALKLVKDNEVVSSTQAFLAMGEYYDTCPAIEKVDIINVLYKSNSSFATVFEQLFGSSAKAPKKSAIDESYQKFFACKNITNPLVSHYDSLNAEINKLYYEIYITEYRQQTLNQENFGSDFFWNGTLDDSDFDVLYDINQVGKILFEDVQESPEILFYRLPSVAWWMSSSLFDQWSYQAWSVTVPSSSSEPEDEVPPPPVTSPPLQNTWNQENITFVDDTTWWNDWVTRTWSALEVVDVPSDIHDEDIQEFIASTYDDVWWAAWALLLGNQCLSEDVVELPEEEPEELMTPEAYIESINAFINNANITSVVNDVLTKRAQEELENTPWLPEPWDPSYPSAVGNIYAEQAFGETAAEGTCEYSCNGLPLDEQAQCQLSCAKSCIQQCDGLWLSDKAICISDCTCFMVAWPTGPWREKVEDMFRIKFCKVPVQNKKSEKRTKVFSIQAIFQEISDVLQWLRDSGQMVKFSETKEFLDGTIKINFAELFDFKLQFGFKPVFEQRKAVIEQKKWEEHNSDLGLGILNMNTANVEADDYNKYIVVADVERNKAMSQPVNTLSDIPKNIDAFKQARAVAVEQNLVLPKDFKTITSSYVQQTNILFVQNMMEFLEDNQLFWYNMTNDLLDMTSMSLQLQAKIENSK